MLFFIWIFLTTLSSSGNRSLVTLFCIPWCYENKSYSTVRASSSDGHRNFIRELFKESVRVRRYFEGVIEICIHLYKMIWGEGALIQVNVCSREDTFSFASLSENREEDQFSWIVNHLHTGTLYANNNILIVQKINPKIFR